MYPLDSSVSQNLIRVSRREKALYFKEAFVKLHMVYF